MAPGDADFDITSLGVCVPLWKVTSCSVSPCFCIVGIAGTQKAGNTAPAALARMLLTYYTSGPSSFLIQ